MPFIHNSKNIQPSDGKFQIYPEDDYSLVIREATETVSKGPKTNGMPMIALDLEIIEHEKLQGKPLKHWIVFMPEGMDGAGVSVHFRKCIGVPYGGEDEVNASDWVGKKLKVHLKVKPNTYKDKKTGEMVTSNQNKITGIMPYGDDFPEIKKEEEVPF